MDVKGQYLIIRQQSIYEVVSVLKIKIVTKVWRHFIRTNANVSIDHIVMYIG